MTLPATIGRYRVIGELGRGAMGVVYRGVDPSLDRPVAIKVIGTRAGASAVPSHEMEARFLREARVAARINHPNVVTIYDAGREGDSLYLVMELIEGESLAERLARAAHPTMPEALALIARVAEALAVAHSLGIVHRDIKPGNIMLTGDGGVKVADFGVAKAVGEETNLTRTGIVVGSPAYMAPEQVRGQELDGRADIFSLGVVLYELLLRRKPFPSETVTTLIYQILHEDPLAAPEPSRLLPDDVRAFLRKCLQKNPQDRMPDGQTMANEARALSFQLTGSAAPFGVTAPISAAAPVDALPFASSPPGSTANAAGVGSTSPTVIVGTPATPPPVPPPLPGVTPPAVFSAPAATAVAVPVRAKRRVAEMVIVALGVVLLAVAAFVVVKGRRAGTDSGASEAQPPTEPTAIAEYQAGAPIPTEAPAPQTTEVPLTIEPTPVGTPTPWVWPTALPTRAPTVLAIQPVWTPPQEVAPEPTPTRVPPTPTATPPPITEVFECQTGAKFGVDPDDALVEINGVVLGIADDWDGMGGGEVYTFPGEGTYLVKLSLEGYETAWVHVVVKADAKRKVVTVNTELEKQKKRKKKDEGDSKREKDNEDEKDSAEKKDKKKDKS